MDDFPRDPLNPKKPLAWDPNSPAKFTKVIPGNHDISLSHLSGQVTKAGQPVTLSFFDTEKLAQPETTGRFGPLKGLHQYLVFMTIAFIEFSQDFIRELFGFLQSWNRDTRILSRIQRPPGSLLFEFFEFFCSARTAQKIIGPTISDYQLEYNDALAQQRMWKARWIRFIRGPFTLLRALGFLSIAEFIRELFPTAK